MSTPIMSSGSANSLSLMAETPSSPPEGGAEFGDSSHHQPDNDLRPSDSATWSPEGGGVPMSPQIYRSTTGSAKLKDGVKTVKKMFTRGPPPSDDGLENGDTSGGRRKKMPMFSALKTNNHPGISYRFHILGRPRRTNVRVAVDEYDNGCTSDPEGYNEFDGSEDDPDSGEGGVSFDLRRIEELEAKIRELNEIILRKEEEGSRSKLKDLDIHSPDSDEKPNNKSWMRPLVKRRSPSIDHCRKKRDRCVAQLETLKTTPTSSVVNSNNRFMGNTRKQLGSGFRNISHSLGLKRLNPRFKRPKSAGDDDALPKSVSLEDVHPSSGIYAAVDEGEEDVEEFREEVLNLLDQHEQTVKELTERLVKSEAVSEGLQQQLSSLSSALSSERGKTDQLEVNFMEVMELKRHEVEQLTHVEKQSLERQQFLEEQLDEYQSKVEKLEVYIYSTVAPDLPKVVEASPPVLRRMVMRTISLLLFLISTLLAVFAYLKTAVEWGRDKLRQFPWLLVAGLGIFLAMFLYWALLSTTTSTTASSTATVTATAITTSQDHSISPAT